MIHCELKFTTDSPEELAKVAAAIAEATGREVAVETTAPQLAKPDRAEVGQWWADMEGDCIPRRVVHGPDRDGAYALGDVSGRWGAYGADLLTEQRWTYLGNGDLPSGVRPADAAPAWRPKAPPIPGPTARDAVAGMLLRHRWHETAQRLADGAWSVDAAVEHMRAQYPHSKIPAEDQACLAALEALAAREACPVGHGVDDACAECAPGEQAKGDGKEVEALRKRHRAMQDNLIGALQDYSKLVRELRGPLGAERAEYLPDAAQRLRSERDALKAEIRDAREELGAWGDEPLAVAARRVAETLTQELGRGARKREPATSDTHDGVTIAAPEAMTLEELARSLRARPGLRLVFEAEERRVAAEAYRRGQEGMRERAASFLESFVGARVVAAVRELPLDATTTAPCSAVLDTNHAIACDGKHAPGDAHHNDGLRWGEGSAAYPTQVSVRPSPGNLCELSREDTETLRGSGIWRQDGEVWRGLQQGHDGFYDPRTPFGAETLRRAAAALRRAPVPHKAQSPTNLCAIAAEATRATDGGLAGSAAAEPAPDREALGRAVHEAACACDGIDAGPWLALGGRAREKACRIGERLFAMGVQHAGRAPASPVPAERPYLAAGQRWLDGKRRPVLIREEGGLVVAYCSSGPRLTFFPGAAAPDEWAFDGADPGPEATRAAPAPADGLIGVDAGGGL